MGRQCSRRNFIPEYIDEMIKEQVLEEPQSHIHTKQAQNQKMATGEILLAIVTDNNGWSLRETCVGEFYN
jgi:hypothetical protein